VLRLTGVDTLVCRIVTDIDRAKDRGPDHA
jgi:hypothetical protein